jgi:dienelactone hydrolase
MSKGRRTFLKSNLLFGLWTAVSGMSVSNAAPGRNQPSSHESHMESLLSQYLQCLGGPFPEPEPLHADLGKVIKKNGYRIERITYEVYPGERIAALLLLPDGVTADNPAPGIAVWHQHNGEYHLGKSEPAGLAGNPMHHTAVALVKEGYVVICPDALCFEERQDASGLLKDGDYERFEFLRQVVRGRSLAWKNIWDMMRAIDLLEERAEVLSDKLGCYGHSMGSTHSWLVGPLEPRLKCIIGNCCLPTYEAIEEAHLIHCFPNFVPGWKKYGDTPEIAALIAPRALHLNLGEEDTGTPVASARKGLERISKAYGKAGMPDNFTFYIEPGAGHELTPSMWEQVKTCFARHLKST